MRLKFYKRTKTKFSSKFNFLFSSPNNFTNHANQTEPTLPPSNTTTTSTDPELPFVSRPQSSPFDNSFTPFSTTNNADCCYYDNFESGSASSSLFSSSSPSTNKHIGSLWPSVHQQQQLTHHSNLKKRGKEYNGGVEVDEESPMLEEVVAPSK